MVGSGTLTGWLSRLLSGMLPGSHEAVLEEQRVGALLTKELSKPPGQKDEELVYKLAVDYRERQLRNLGAQAESWGYSASLFEQPDARQCCAAAAWVRQRMAVSYRALQDYFHQNIRQVREELAAAKARRPAAIAAQPVLHLKLPEALQQLPPRLDMCSVCAGQLEQAELREHSCRVHAEVHEETCRKRGMQAVPAVAAASRGPAAPAAQLPAAEAQQGQQSQQGQQQGHQGQQQDQQQDQQQGRQTCGGIDVGDAEGAPATPKQPPLPPQQPQHTSSSPGAAAAHLL